VALFFDQSWFDERLAASGHSLEEIATQLKLSLEQVREIWKDQRELLPHEVSALAGLLHASPAEIADHAGVSTPVPTEMSGADLATLLARMDEMSGRLERIERTIFELKILVLEQRPAPKE
jgi:hypothetical protein